MCLLEIQFHELDEVPGGWGESASLKRSGWRISGTFLWGGEVLWWMKKMVAVWACSSGYHVLLLRSCLSSGVCVCVCASVTV